MATSGYYFVLARRPGGEAVTWIPESTFVLHLPAHEIDVEARVAHKVRPLLGGAHIDSAPTLLYDVSMSLRSGQGLALGSSASGTPSFGTGRQRALALREWLATVDAKLATGSYRLEFHVDPRNHHLIVVPQSRSFTASSGDGTRNGGENFSLRFTSYGLTDRPDGFLSEVAAFISGAEQRVASVAGTIAAQLAVAQQVLRVPATVAGLLTTTLRTFEAIAAQLPLIVQGTASVASLPASIYAEAIDGASALARVFIDLESYTDAETWNRLAAAAAAAGSATKAMARNSRSVVDASFGLPSNSGATSIAASASANASVEAPSGAFAYFSSNAATYTGWTPYAAVPGESLLDISVKMTGDAKSWVAIAMLNEIGPMVSKPTTLKIPVIGGGLPWDSSVGTNPASASAALAELIYFRDFRVTQTPDGRFDWVIDEDSLRDIRTVTGLDNYVQRYSLVFRTELEENPTFPAIGVYLGIGQPQENATRGLTGQTARAQLLSDPRTVTVVTVADRDAVDFAEVELLATTPSSAVTLGVP